MKGLGFDPDPVNPNMDLRTQLGRRLRADAFRGNLRCLTSHLEAGADSNFVDEPGEYTALILAAHRGHTEVVRALLDVPGIDVDYTDGHGATALHHACTQGELRCAEALLAAGAAPDRARTDNGSTPLVNACDFGHADVVVTLLALGRVDAEHACHDDETPLSTAAANGWHRCVRAIAPHCDVNRRVCGRSALHVTRCADTAAALLLAGACRFLHNRDGITPQEAAYGNAAVVAVFDSGIDYWHRVRHAKHGHAMREAVATLLLVWARVGSLPVEMWLLVCTFVRSADWP